MYRIVILFGALLAVQPMLVVAQESRLETASFRADAETDQNLFLMCYLEHVLRTWRAPAVADHEFNVWVAGTRTQLVQFQKVAEIDGLDDDVVACLRDVIELLNDYDTFSRSTGLSEFITSLHKTQFDASAPSSIDGVLTGATAGVQIGAAVGSLAGPAGGLVGGAGVGAVGGAIGYFSFDKYEAALKVRQGIDDARRQFLLAESRRLRSKIDSVYQGLRITAKRLGDSKGYNWGAEAGFDDVSAVSLEEQAKRRPKNPFLKVLNAQTNRRKSRAERVAACCEAARLVPNDGTDDIDVYDNLRAAMLISGARIACEGMNTSTIDFQPPVHSEGKANVSAAATVVVVGAILWSIYTVRTTHKSDAVEKDDDPNVAEAIRLFRAAQHFCKSMPARDRQHFADALLVAKEWKEAATQYQVCQPAKPAPQFSFKFACALSGAGATEDAWKHFSAAYGTVPSWKPALLDNPHLTNLANAKSEAMTLLVKPPIVATWKQSRETISFEPYGRFSRQTGSTTTPGTYRFVATNQVRVDTKGLFGTTEQNFRFRVDDGRLILTPLTKGLFGYVSGTPITYDVVPAK